MAIVTESMQKLRRFRLYKNLIVLIFSAIAFGVFFHGRATPLSFKKVTFVQDRKVVVLLDSKESIAIPLVHPAAYDKVPFLEFSSNGKKWKTTAVCAQSIGDLMAELAIRQTEDAIPIVAFVQDSAGDEYVAIIGKEHESALSSLQFLADQSMLEAPPLQEPRYLGIKALDSSAEPDVLSILIGFQK